MSSRFIRAAGLFLLLALSALAVPAKSYAQSCQISASMSGFNTGFSNIPWTATVTNTGTGICGYNLATLTVGTFSTDQYGLTAGGVSNSSGAICGVSPSGNPLVCTFPGLTTLSLTPGQSLTLAFQANENMATPGLCNYTLNLAVAGFYDASTLASVPTQNISGQALEQGCGGGGGGGGTAAPAFSVTKAASANFTAGQQALYTLQITNTGTAATTAVSTVTDTIDPTLTINALSSGCSVVGQAVTCTVPSGLAVNASIGFTITVTPTVAAVGATITNTANISGGGAANSTSNTVTSPVAGAPVLTLTKFASANFVVGQLASYTLTATNTGTAATTAAASITDTIGSTLTIGTLPSGCSATGQIVTCTVPTGLAVNATATFVIPVTPTAAAAGITISNTASLTGGGDPNCAANCASNTVSTPVLVPRLAISKSEDFSFTVGEPNNFTLVVTNTGTTATTAVATVTDVLDPTLTLGTLPSGCSSAGQVVTCTVPIGLAVNASATFIIPVTPTPAAVGASIRNVASVAGGGDPDCAIASACNSNTVVTSPIVGVPALSISKTASSTHFTVGEQASYTLTVTNSGTAATTAEVTITDAIDATLIIGELPAGCSASAQTVTCIVAVGLAVNASATFVVPVTPTLAAANTEISNTARLTGTVDPRCAVSCASNTVSTEVSPTPVPAPALNAPAMACLAALLALISTAWFCRRQVNQ